MEKKRQEKAVIYQIFTRLYGNQVSNPVSGGTILQNGCGKMNGFTGKSLARIRDLGATHIWLTGIIAHASQTDYSEYGIPASHPATVKGIAGSPYAIRDYYDVDPDLAVSVPDRMKEFTLLVRRIHKAGMKVIIDFVPNHLARQYHSTAKPENIGDMGQNDDISMAFSPSNNFYYITGQQLAGEVDWNGYVEMPAKATGNDRFTAFPSRCDWYETVKLNYGIDYSDGSRHFDPVPDTWNKMLDILLFWAGKGIDAFRCDMAEMVPVEFWHWAISSVKSRFSSLEFIAEVYNPGLYQSYIEFGGFDWLYDKVGLYDTLRSITEGRESAQAITGCWQRTGSCGTHMLHFMENHDEQRIASSFFAGSGEAGRAAMIVSALMDTCPVMVYAGQEIGEKGMDNEGFSGVDGRTTIFDYWSPDTLRRLCCGGTYSTKMLTERELKLQNFYTSLLKTATEEKAVAEGKFFDLMYVNPFSTDFDAYRQYAFLRGNGKEMILVVANFGELQTSSVITIPSHAFDYMCIPSVNSCKAKDLLSGETLTVPLLPDGKIRLTVPPLSGVVLKFEL